MLNMQAILSHPLANDEHFKQWLAKQQCADPSRNLFEEYQA